MQVRCPHCKRRQKIPDDRHMEPVECERCGKEFKAIGLVTTALADELFARVVPGDRPEDSDS